MQRKSSLKETCSKIVTAYNVLKPTKWMPPDVMVFIEDYFERHPEKKRSRRLERKLEREFYRSMRLQKKTQKLMKR